MLRKLRLIIRILRADSATLRIIESVVNKVEVKLAEQAQVAADQAIAPEKAPLPRVIRRVSPSQRAQNFEEASDPVNRRARQVAENLERIKRYKLSEQQKQKRG